MNKRGLRRGALTLLCTALLLGTNVTGALGAEALPKAPVKGVTYAGREWVINFWSTETEYLEEDLRQIREDGFNTIILCVPWREFQPYLSNSFFNDYAITKLQEICREAEEQGLSVMLRLGYSWDYYDNFDVLARYERLIWDDTYLDAWKAYAKKIYETVSSYASYQGAFLTWEDFWNFVDKEKTLPGTYNGRKLAEDMGFRDYVLSHYDRETLLELYGEEDLAEDPEFPAPDSPAYKLFFEWYDQWLNELLQETQEVFPGLSMECRLDQDPYPLPDGSLAGYNHSATFPCGSAAYSSVMLSASMGYPEGMELNAADTAAMSAHLLSNSAAYGGKPVFVDQFLYMETTPGYEQLPYLPEEQVNDYLTRMGDVFRRQTIGYGIWTYRDYADSVIYNPEFGLKLKGWDTMGTVSVTEQDGSLMAKLSQGASLSQDLSYRNYLSEDKVMFEARVIAESPTTLTVTVGGISRKVTVQGDSLLELEFPGKSGEKIQIRAGGQVLLDNIKLYSHLTEGGIYELHGEPGPYLEGIRACNAAIG